MNLVEELLDPITRMTQTSEAMVGQLPGPTNPPRFPTLRAPRWSVHLVHMLGKPSRLILLGAVVVYCWYWATLTVARYHAMYASVYDLGLFFQHIWLLTSPQLSPVDRLTYALDQPFLVLLVPLVLTNSYPTALVVQTIALGAAALPLYLIALRLLRSEWTATLLAVSYLLYPAVGGVNWFDAHYIAFFIPLFFLGYMFFLERRWKPALACLFLAAATEYPSVLIVILFGLTLLIEPWFRRPRPLPENEGIPRRFVIQLLGLTLALFAYQALYLGDFRFGPAVSALIGTSHSSGGISGGLPSALRLYGLFIVLGPLLALPALKPRWLILASPVLVLTMVSDYPGYVFPNLLQDQYLAITIPPLFVGLVYAVQRSQGPRAPAGEDFGPPGAGRNARRRSLAEPGRLPLTLCVAVLISTSAFALAFQPYGPLNSISGDPYSVASRTTANTSYYDQVQSAIALVPRSTPYVLFQNDMPTMLPRPLDYFDTPLVTGIGNWENVTEWDALQNSFPLITPLGVHVSARIDYAVDAPYGWGFTEQGRVPGNTMANFVKVLYGSGEYGILGEIGGNLVLERGYLGVLRSYVPYTINLSGAQACPANCALDGSTASVSNVVDQGVTWGTTSTQLTLSPGWYTFTFELRTTDRSSNNVYLQLVRTADSVSPIASFVIRGSDFLATNAWEPFNLTVYLNNTYATVAFPGTSTTWAGTLDLGSVLVRQIAPPATSVR